MLTGVLKQRQPHSVWHVQIEDDHVVVAFGQQMSGRSFVMGPRDVEALRFEIIEQLVTEVPIILHDQHREVPSLGRSRVRQMLHSPGQGRLAQSSAVEL